MKLPADSLTAPSHPVARLPAEWEERVVAWGEPAYRGKQIFDWIHRQGVLDPDEMSNLPKALRERLKEEGVGWPITIVSAHESADQTKKLLVGMPDGEKVETVLIPQLGDERIVTQCISSQVGCAMGCVFCASGVAGLKRQMTDAEIVAQVLLGRRELRPDQRIRNVVFMGMGEPLHNYDAVARSLVLLTHPDGIDLSKRRVTVSTSGLVKQIDRLGKEFDGQVQLAISLHAVRDEDRSKIMPVNRKHGLSELTDALRRYPMSKRARITIEYTLIKGVNDSIRDANGMVELLRGIPVKSAKMPMSANGRYLAEHEGERGMIKVVVHADTRALLGVHMIGGACSEMIFGAGAMIETETRVDEIKEMVFPHPTTSELIRDTLLGIHF